MIDLNSIQTPAGWAQAAETLLAAGRDAAKARDLDQMKQAGSDLLAFIQGRTSDCPQAVLDAVVGGQSEIALAIDSAAVGAIDAATVQLSAFVIDVQRATDDLNRKAKLIALQPVIDTVNSLTSLITNAKALQARIASQSPATLDLAGIQGGVQAIIDQLTTVAGDLKSVTGLS